MPAPPQTPLWLKLTAATVLVVSAGWWLHDRADRHQNEARLSAVASQIAGRAVHVRCPGPVGRLFGWDIVEGSVAFSAEGKPADETKLRKLSCAELDALAEGTRARELSCTEPQGRGLARDQYLEAYRSSTCMDGGQGDLHPDDTRFP